MSFHKVDTDQRRILVAHQDETRGFQTQMLFDSGDQFDWIKMSDALYTVEQLAEAAMLKSCHRAHTCKASILIPSTPAA